MTRKSRRILKEALALSVEDRVKLTDALFLSLDADPDIEEAWRQEVLRRVEEVDAGRAKTIPWSKVRARLMAELSRK